MKWLKRIFIGLLVIILLIFLFVRLALHESRPTVVEGDAEQLARQMLHAIDKEAWDTLRVVAWTFPGGHDYIWDREANNALIRWEGYEVHLDMDAVDGRAFKEGDELNGANKRRAIKKAWKFWCNDSFWLCAPSKIYDPGTTRALALDEDGETGLLVTYESGGVTPGDQYLWFQDDSGLPTGFKMWVKIIPVGGIYASWENWITVTGGARIATTRHLGLGGLTIEISDIKGAMSWSDLGFDGNPVHPE